MIKTNLTPNEIIGFENMPIFKAHYEICISGTNAGVFPAGRLDKEVGRKNREIIIGILQHLRDNGFYPLGVDERGKIRWGVVTRSASLALFDNHELRKLERMPIEDLMKMGRSGYVKIVEKVSVSEVEEYEMDAAR